MPHPSLLIQRVRQCTPLIPQSKATQSLPSLLIADVCRFVLLQLNWTLLFLLFLLIVSVSPTPPPLSPTGFVLQLTSLSFFFSDLWYRRAAPCDTFLLVSSRDTLKHSPKCPATFFRSFDSVFCLTLASFSFCCCSVCKACALF